MANQKKVYGSEDAAPAVLYAKEDAASENAYPVVCTTSGALHVDVTNDTIEQITGDTHNDLNIAVAGKDTGGKVRPFLLDTTGKILLAGFGVPSFDEIALSYTGTNLTGVVYKLATVTQATLTLSYSGSTLTGVVKT